MVKVWKGTATVAYGTTTQLITNQFHISWCCLLKWTLQNNFFLWNHFCMYKIYQKHFFRSSSFNESQLVIWFHRPITEWANFWSLEGKRHVRCQTWRINVHQKECDQAPGEGHNSNRPITSPVTSTWRQQWRFL